MNISNLKSRFPVFKKNPNLVFLDTAASALKVDEMIEATIIVTPMNMQIFIEVIMN